VHWLTVEVFDGDRPVAGLTAAGWARAWHDRVVETAVTGGAVFWDEHEHSWGVVLEFCFAEEHLRDAFRDSPLLRAALDAVPDPVSGVLVYPHRGGGTGVRQPRAPRPRALGGAAALPEPDPEADRVLPCTEPWADELPGDRARPGPSATR
jgi:hypothetical protein